MRALDRISIALVIIAMLIFSIYYSLFAYKHWSLFLTAGHDDAIYVQSMWTTLNGKLFWNTLDATGNGISHLAIHSSLILFLLLPFFKLAPNAFALNFIQVIALALGAIPVYLLGSKWMGRFTGAILALCYLLSPFLGYNIYDTFHPSGFIIPLVLFSYYFYVKQKISLYFIFLILTLSCREDASLSIFLFGIYLLLFQRKRYIGGVTSFLGIGWFLFSIKLLQPRLGLVEPLEMLNSPFGNNIKEIAVNFFLTPLSFIKNSISWPKILFIIKILFPFGFLPFLSPSLLLPVLPMILQNIILMASTHKAISLISARYYDSAIPFLFIATVCTLNRYKNKLFKYKLSSYLSAFFLITTILSYWFYGPLGIANELFSKFYNSEEVRKHADAIRDIAQYIPDSASVSSDGKVLPILARRHRLYWYPTHIDGSDYIIIDNKWPIYFICGTTLERYHTLKKDLIKKHGILKQIDGMYLIQRREGG